jgi:hypothetical protein
MLKIHVCYEEQFSECRFGQIAVSSMQVKMQTEFRPSSVIGILSHFRNQSLHKHIDFAAPGDVIHLKLY